MPRFNNGTPGTGMGRGFGNGRGANCRANTEGRPSNGYGQSEGLGLGRRSRVLGQGQPFERDPDFFRRNCLGITGQDIPADNSRISRIQSALDSLQRQIDSLKNLDRQKESIQPGGVTGNE